MSSQILLLDRVEFSTIKIETNAGDFPLAKNFPQIEFAPEGMTFLTRSDLLYPDEELEDPRHFVLSYGIKIASSEAVKPAMPPYDIEVEASGYFRYVGGDEFKEERRFRAVRFSGYQILYGAIREMVCNLTARGRHGLLHLPARNFNEVANTRAIEDELARKKAIEGRIQVALDAPKKPRKRVSAKKMPI